MTFGQFTLEDIPIADDTSGLKKGYANTGAPSKVQNEKACGPSGALADLGRGVTN